MRHFWVKVSEYIDKSRMEVFRERLPFFVCKAGTEVIGIGVGEIDRLMRDIQIAAPKDRFGYLQFFP